MATNDEILIKLKALDELTPVMLKALQSMEASSAKMTEALEHVGTAAKKTSENTEGLNGKTVTLGVGFMAVKEAAELAYKAFQKVQQFIGHCIDESLEAEKAFNRLQGALIGTGQYTKELAVELNEYAEAQQALTGASAETIQNIMSTGIQMGLSVEKAKELEQATRKLAAATGESLESAMSTMQASLAGQSRGLGKVLPQVKELSAAQLKSGEAIDIVNKALDAQYKLYQGSFSGSLAVAQSAMGDVTKELGNLITKSPLATTVIKAFTTAAFHVADALKVVNDYLQANPEKVEKFVKALGLGILVVGGITAAFSAASIAAGVLAGVMAVLTSPITLVVAGVAALTAAFYKWPGLFDILVGAVKTFIGIALSPLALAFGTLTSGIGTVVGIFNKDLGNSIKAAGDKLAEFRDHLILGGIESVKFGAANISGGEAAKKGADTAADALEKSKEAASRAAKAALELQKSYDGFAYGTSKQRAELEKQASDRDGDLKDFTQYLENKKRLAISKADEEHMELNKIRAKALEGAGSQGQRAKSTAEVDAEIKKQADLKVLRDQGILDLEQYNAALLESTRAKQAAEQQMGMAHAQALADALGTSEAGYQMRLQIEEQRFQLDLQNKMTRAQIEMASEEQLNSLKEQTTQEHHARLRQMKQQQLEDEIKKNQALGNDWEVTLGKMRLAQEKDGKLLGTIRGAQQTNEYKGTMNALNDLASLRSSKSKEAFELGKKAAIAQATIKTFEAATSAYAAMAAIPFVGPVLGAAAAAAAIAAGFVQIQNINAQQFSQAHGGIDEIPQSMSNKTFLLDGGERVLQPEANKDLTNFLRRQQTGEGGGSGGGQSISITLHYNGSGGQQDARQMADIVIEEIRARSERGAPIMSSKGVIQE
jgi:hypothetical protein